MKIGEMKMVRMMRSIGLQKDKIDKIEKVHNYLDELPAVGKVLSFSSI